MPCMDWLCNAVCYCGCQANGLQRRFVPDAAPFPALAEGDFRFFLNSSVTPLGELMAIALTPDQTEHAR